MSFEEAYKETCKYAKFEEDAEIGKVVDIGNSWVFILKRNHVDYGGTALEVKKETGKGYLFTLSDEDNQNKIRNGIIVPLPQ